VKQPLPPAVAAADGDDDDGDDEGLPVYSPNDEYLGGGVLFVGDGEEKRRWVDAAGGAVAAAVGGCKTGRVGGADERRRVASAFGRARDGTYYQGWRVIRTMMTSANMVL